ncbi:RNA polymerase sigma factor [Candidatus Formimonas warabiya]|uniref:RNA polymerase subunit sigma-70 n=1 Tax=Formimonas warabiya TaxID=1761012 RepID=A0A3G1KVU7_FORW1|nr:sigma-70 family RNA polymerase sigma factor [Candidatus Formimonas warabiya]ATW26572.1 RNA polymerase subunit sigma-70 [Candidatus Formimonas warabiya]
MVTLTQTEETSLVAPANDHERTFVELYNSYFSRVYNYVHYRVNDFHDADDLTGQIFAKLFSKLKYYRPEKAPFAAWVFSIARNAVTDYYRSRMRNPSTPLEETADFIDSRPGPEDIAADHEMHRHLRKALASLTQREREIIALKFWSGFTNRDIARFTGISESNTGIILFRAMRRLRQILESQGMSIDDGND